MSYTTGGITYLGSTQSDLGLVLCAATTHADQVIQAYAAGELVAWARPTGGTVQFALAGVAPGELVFLLAVDADQAEQNFWDQAFPAAAEFGNRIRVQTPQTIAPHGPSDTWRVYRGDAGGAEADALAHQQPFYPSLQRAGGLGASFGHGGLGWDGVGAAGWGVNLGLGEWGFDCEMLQWTSPPLPPGDYPIRVTVEDEFGNESAAFETTVTLHTFPRPPSDLAVSSYDPHTDTLAMSFTPSDDV